MNNAIGRRLYYLKATGEVIQDTGERTGWVVETTVEQDFETYRSLRERVPETVGMIQLEYGAYAADRAEGGSITRIDMDTMEPMFTYRDPIDPGTPQEPGPALSEQLTTLKTENESLKSRVSDVEMTITEILFS
ncbi:hypothetical protein SAMN05661091_0862 [Paenibacillus uliginis N3/975]|uniref:Uncharacterized protein n=1 Tax=Paenibacillus uliginis N3/975 TaxID=1313296 RepID=A0A1X7GNU8_9BACL|nr:hypothetical protein [Paenibacillus uliginis]SMF72372.1 hypothetical protein SAMN05661091_0862 [Paenibacillus uliginis N3/975]